MNALPSPKGQWRRLGLHLGALAVLAGVSLSAHADTRIMDDIAQQYKNASVGWSGTLLGFANRLFALLALIELAWSAAVWVLDKSEFQSLFAAIAKKIMWIGMFYALLLNGPVWIPAIVDSFVDAGAAAGGGAGLSPTDVFNTGIMNAATLVSGMSALDILKDPAMMMFGGLSAIIMVLAFAVIAGQLLIALVESYIAISAGMLFLGFGGSRWTTDFVQKFIGYAVATGVKLFMLYLVISIGNTQALTWAPMLTNALGAATGDKFNVILTVMGGSVLLAFLAMQIPSMAASMLAGSPTLTAGGAAGTGAAIGAGMVGAGATLASTTVGAAKAAGGLVSAAQAAWSEAGAGGATGLSRAVSTLGNMGSAAGSVMKSSAANSLAPTFGGRMAEVSSARAAEKGAAAGSPSPSGGQSGAPSTPPAPTAEPSAGSTSSGQAPTGGSGEAASAPVPTSEGTASGGTPSAAPTVAPPPGAGGEYEKPAYMRRQAAQAAPAAAPSAEPMSASSGSSSAPAESGAAVTPAPAPNASASAGPTVAPPGSAGGSSTPAPAAPTAAPAASEANNVGAAATTASAPTAPMPQGPGLQERLDQMRNVRAPQLPPDAAAPATVSIRFDGHQD